jgi:hypothetical protein
MERWSSEIVARGAEFSEFYDCEVKEGIVYGG